MPPAWFPAAALWLVLDEQAAAPRTMHEVTRLALAGGADAVVFRHRHAPAVEVLELGKPVRAMCRERNVPFILSHYAELARELQPEAVQLGVADPPLAEVRHIVGPRVALGFSAHSLGEARAKLREGCDYCFLGPVYATPEKLKYGAPLGLGAVSGAGELADSLVFIGGINRHNVLEVLAAGGQRIAVISAVQHGDDPQAAALELKALLLSGRFTRHSQP
jgi:thiamine-phosphate pyrophosphorylase